MNLQRVVVWLAAATALCAAPAAAQDVTFEFRGVISERFGPYFPDIVEGTPFHGTYTFNLGTPDTNNIPTVGDYWHYSAPYGVAVDIAGHRFQTDPTNVQFLIELSNDHGVPTPSDNYVLHSYVNNVTSGTSVPFISWQLDGTSLAALGSTYLSDVPPNLGDWTQRIRGGLLERRRASRTDYGDRRYRHAVDAADARTVDERTAGTPGPTWTRRAAG